MDCPRVGYPDFQAAAKQMLEESGFVLLHDQQDKVMQMYETMMTRHSTMLVGPTGGGKTVVMNTLVRAQTHMGLPTKVTIVNPKVNWLFCMQSCNNLKMLLFYKGHFCGRALRLSGYGHKRLGGRSIFEHLP